MPRRSQWDETNGGGERGRIGECPECLPPLPWGHGYKAVWFCMFAHQVQRAEYQTKTK